MPVKSTNKFPKIDAISDDFVCKNTKQANIEGVQGRFCGPVNRVTSLPHGYGIFIEGNWVHCCCVANGAFAGGKRVSVDK